MSLSIIRALQLLREKVSCPFEIGTVLIGHFEGADGLESETLVVPVPVHGER
jgi:hypothetical protein